MDPWRSEETYLYDLRASSYSRHPGGGRPVHAQCTLSVRRMILSCNKYMWVMFIRALKNDASTSGLQSSSEPQRYIDSLQSAVQVCVFM